MRSLFPILVVLLLSACSGLECGQGTHEEDGMCVANILTACGEGTVYEHGYCIPADISTADADEADATAEEVRDGQDAP